MACIGFQRINHRVCGSSTSILLHERGRGRLGEENVEEVGIEELRDMRDHNIDLLTIGQYLAPSNHHLPVQRYVHPDTFKRFEAEALAMGFNGAACGPMVRSSYWADQQAHSAGLV